MVGMRHVAIPATGMPLLLKLSRYPPDLSRTKEAKDQSVRGTLRTAMRNFPRNQFIHANCFPAVSTELCPLFRQDEGLPESPSRCLAPLLGSLFQASSVLEVNHVRYIICLLHIGMGDTVSSEDAEESTLR